MRYQSKIEVSISNPLGGVDHILIKGKTYECNLVPKIYDTSNFKPSEPSYLVKCEDGKMRKYHVEHFIDISEVREKKLKELGI